MNTNLAYANQPQQGGMLPQQPAVEPQVHRQLATNGEAVDQLASSLADLVIRLKPVLRDEPPVNETSKCGAIPQEYMVPLADTLRHQTQKVQALAEGIRSILSRLEL